MATTRVKVPQHGQEQHNIFSPGSPDSDTLMQKDETEARLEKLVFGDEAGFLEALGSNNHGQALVLERDSDQDLPIGRLENSDLEDVADEEVRRVQHLQKYNAKHLPPLAIRSRLCPFWLCLRN